MLFNWHHFPFVRFLLPFIAGILLHNFLPLNVNLYFSISISIGIAFLIYSIPESVNSNYNFRWIFGLLTTLTLFIAGFLLNNFHNKTTPIIDLTDNEYVIAKVIEEPVKKLKSYKTGLLIKEAIINGNKNNINKKAILYSPLDFNHINLEYGELVVIQTKWNIPSEPANPFQFNYKNYLAKNGIFYQGYVENHQLIRLEKQTHFSLQKLIHQIRRFVVNTYKNYHFSNQELGVASALIIGYKEELDSDTKASYSRAGAIHILAVSGLHVGIIFIMISKLLFFLKNKPWQKLIRFILIITLLWFYALLSGFSPSVLRATVMFSFILPATIWKLPSNIYNTIALSAFFLLLFDTNMLFDVGFELSYIAVIGIIYYYPKFQYWFVSKYKILNWIWSIISVSLAAQLATMPLTLYYFGQFPNYFLIGNLLIVPFAGIITYLGIGSIAFSFIPYLSDAIGFIFKYAIYLMNTVIFWIEKLPYSYADNLPLTVLQMILFYILIIYITLFFDRRRKKYLIFSLSSFAIILLTFLFRQYSIQNQQFFIIYNLNKTSYLEVIDERIAYNIPTDTISEMNYGLFVRPVHQKRGIRRTIPLDKSNFYFQYPIVKAGPYSIYIFDKEQIPIRYDHPLVFDFLWIRNSKKVQPEEILNSIHTRKVIIDNRLSVFKENHWTSVCDSMQIPYYSMRKNGAFIQNW